MHSPVIILFLSAATVAQYSISAHSILPRQHTDTYRSDDVTFSKQNGAAGKERKNLELINGLSQLNSKTSGIVEQVHQRHNCDVDRRKSPSSHASERSDQRTIQRVEETLPSRDCVELLQKIRDNCSDHVTTTFDVTELTSGNWNWSDHDIVAYTYELTSHCVISVRTAWMIRRSSTNSKRFRLYLEVLSKLESRDIKVLMTQCGRNANFIKNMLATLQA